MKKSVLFIFTALTSFAMADMAYSEGDQKPPHKLDWSFDGVLGTIDKPSAQRGFQIYKEVCSACHSLNRVAFRNLTEIGFSEGEVKALAASYQITDGPNDNGEMFQRPGKPSDSFVPPYPNENAARAVNNGAAPPDLSLIIKARHDGPNYIYSLLTGFSTPPANVKLANGQYYNPYIAGERLAMPPPLSDGRVTYVDGTPSTLDQESRDIVNFLQWAAEPEMESRKQMGIKAMIYLALFTAFMYVAKRNLWRKLH